jgi:hypothetical protein
MSVLILVINIIMNDYQIIFLCSAIDIFLNDDESNEFYNNSNYYANISFESTNSSSDASLEDNATNSSSDDSLENDELNELDNNSIYSVDISFEDDNLNEDIINDTDRSMHFGKQF